MKKAKALEGPEVVDREDDEKQEPHDWEVEDAVKTMQKADKIKKDPKMMGHVHKHISKQITSLKGLKKLGLRKAMEENE